MNEREEIRRLISLAKILLFVMIVLIVVEFVSCAQEVKAGVITGEKALGGASLLMQMVYEKEHGIEDIDLELLQQFSPERIEIMWEKEFDAYVHNGVKLGVEKVYRNIKMIKFDKDISAINIYMEDGSNVAVDGESKVVSIRIRQKWGL